MKTILTLALLSGMALPAYAQVPVQDNASLFQQAKSLAQEVKSYATQLQQLQQAAQQVQWAAASYESFVHAPSLGGAMGLMGQVGISNPLPINPMSVQGLIGGHGGLSGTLGSLSSMSNTSFADNHVYTSNDGSWTSQRMGANANSIAGTQGAALQIFQQMSAHYPVIQSLRGQLLQATTPKDVQDIQAQISAEQMWTQSAQTQLQTISLMDQAQARSVEQQQNERLNQSIDDAISRQPGG